MSELGKQSYRKDLRPSTSEEVCFVFSKSLCQTSRDVLHHWCTGSKCLKQKEWSQYGPRRKVHAFHSLLLYMNSDSGKNRPAVQRSQGVTWCNQLWIKRKQPAFQREEYRSISDMTFTIILQLCPCLARQIPLGFSPFFTDQNYGSAQFGGTRSCSPRHGCAQRFSQVHKLLSV